MFLFPSFPSGQYWQDCNNAPLAHHDVPGKIRRRLKVNHSYDVENSESTFESTESPKRQDTQQYKKLTITFAILSGQALEHYEARDSDSSVEIKHLRGKFEWQDGIFKFFKKCK